MTIDGTPDVFETGTARFTRMRPPAAVSDDVREFLVSTKFYRPGRPLLIHQVLSNHARAARSLNRFLDWGDEAVLDGRQRRLLILRTAALADCRYEWNVHSQVARTTGELTAEEVRSLEDTAALLDGWGPKDGALLALADEVCRTNTMSDDAWATCSRVLTDAELIEALVVVGYYRLCAGLLNSLGVPDEGPLG